MAFSKKWLCLVYLLLVGILSPLGMEIRAADERSFSSIPEILIEGSGALGRVGEVKAFIQTLNEGYISLRDEKDQLFFVRFNAAQRPMIKKVAGKEGRRNANGYLQVVVSFTVQKIDHSYVWGSLVSLE
ncbi:hypothetical protein EHO57_14035 [Leptospira langatensis]|uniref:Uncharacterized protein n=1 Tax=Leptospira langatensis TaxID=2484983 RepID=A0A5R2AT74_9LEPT|nr:hypothetical protein [Leptospira langatensis]TGJ99874.1 hypothetical protein EHO57_14035 [Leptospira langatensis]